ncbi:ATP-binding protein [Leptospira sp. 96542]|nr:ATP-binding protein [Leptospira sp. 96542]
MEPNKVKVLEVPNTLDSLSELRKETRNFLNEICPDEIKTKLVFCLDEIITNVIEHGFTKNSPVSLIQVELVDTNEEWKFVVKDEGIPFDPTKVKSETWKQLYESGSDGGFGIRSVKKIMKIEYKRLVPESKNELTLVYPKESF